ncbi:MAG: HAMP domain-containing histidine kinase [Deltaproteobacteria bacterium]|nr:HAMP domain-containing histidine kinase [Deltaproteobacteria bacterium]
MTLRLRLVLTTLVAGVPALIALWVVGNSIRDARDDDLFNAMVLAHFSPAELDACDASPPKSRIGIPLPALKRGVFHVFGDAAELLVFTYDRAGRSSQPDAPALPPEVLDEVRASSGPVGRSFNVMIGGNRHLLLGLPREGGPCALALIATPRLGPPGPPPVDLLVPIALALVAGLVGIWPVVRRIRSMTLAVRRWDEGAPLGLPRDVGRDELSELSRAFADSAETIRRQHAALVAREKALLEFIENTTHDLATPLTVLQGNLSAMAKEHSPEAVRQAMKEAQYIGALLGNLAVSAKFEAAAQVETSLDLGDVVSRVVDRHRAMAKWLGVEIERSIPEEHVLALGDPTFTERALSNLVENAMRHNVSGGHVAVVLETDGSEFVLRVLDDGPGLTREECECALRWDERGDAARSRTSAGGFGLSIVARVAQIQKWRFALTPGEPGGLVAELRGPVA